VIYAPAYPLTKVNVLRPVPIVIVEVEVTPEYPGPVAPVGPVAPDGPVAPVGDG
jgi:hypothetical protein